MKWVIEIDTIDSRETVLRIRNFTANTLREFRLAPGEEIDFKVSTTVAESCVEFLAHRSRKVKN